jgi:predicted transcriptional regulator
MTRLLDERPSTTQPRRLCAHSVMRREVLTVDARTPVAEVWEAMRTNGVEHAVVFEQGMSLGVVALSDIWVAWSLGLSPVAPRSVVALVTPTPCVSGDTDISQLCHVLLQSRNGGVLVLDQRGDVVGLVTPRDVLSVLATEPAPEEESPC